MVYAMRTNEIRLKYCAGIAKYSKNSNLDLCIQSFPAHAYIIVHSFNCSKIVKIVHHLTVFSRRAYATVLRPSVCRLYGMYCG